MDNSVASWVEASSYDFETAEAMLETGRHLYVLFCCQQAVEKRLRGLVAEVTQKMPPRTHDLVRLVGLARVEASEQQQLFLRRLGQYYIETRYPQEMQALAKGVDKALAAKYLAHTREVISWLDQLLKSN